MSALPNLIIPGFPKCGTSSLYYYLSQHEEVDGVEGKEPHVFTSENRFNHRNEIFSGRFSEDRNPAYRLDASTTYMIAPDAPHRIKKASPDCKFIIISRDPIERVFSHYNWLWCNGYIEQDFVPEVRDWESSRFNPNMSFGGNYKYYVEFSRYGEQMKRYLDVFGPDRILLLTTEEMKEVPQQVLNRCFEYLNLTPPEEIDMEQRNVTEEKELTNIPNVLSQFRSAIPDSLAQRLPRKWVKSWFTKTVKPKTFGEEEEAFVFDLLRDDIRKQQALGIFSERWSTAGKFI